MAAEPITGANVSIESPSTPDGTTGSPGHIEAVLAADISQLLLKQSKLLESPLLGPYLYLYEQRSQRVQDMLSGISGHEMDRQARRSRPAEPDNLRRVAQHLMAACRPNLKENSESHEFWLWRSLQSVFAAMYDGVASLRPHFGRDRKAGSCDQPVRAKF